MQTNVQHQVMKNFGLVGRSTGNFLGLTLLFKAFFWTMKIYCSRIQPRCAFQMSIVVWPFFSFNNLLCRCSYQVVAAFVMMWSLHKKGFKAFSMSIPSPRELVQIFEIAAPVFITMTSKVSCCFWNFYCISCLSFSSVAEILCPIGSLLFNSHICSHFNGNYDPCSSSGCFIFSVMQI